jgi:hypothetical protein
MGSSAERALDEACEQKSAIRGLTTVMNSRRLIHLVGERE